MVDRCYAGPPDENGHGGCRAYERSSKQAGELWERALLCQLCLEVAERDVRALVLDYRDLEQLLPPSLGVQGDGQPRGRSNPLPFREAAYDLQMEITWLCTAWEEVIREADNLSPLVDWSKRRRDGFAVAQAVRVLAPRLRLLAELPPVMLWDYPGSAERASEVAGYSGVLDLARLHQRARSALGLTDPRKEIIWGVECRNPECTCVNTLVRLPGRDVVQCDECSARMEQDRYGEWTRLLAAQVCGLRNGDWWCARPKKHEGGCEPARAEAA